MKKLLLLFLISTSYPIFAQPGIFNQFLLSSPASAEISGLGGAGVTGQFSDIAAFYYNPALSAGSFGKLAFSYGKTNYFSKQNPVALPHHVTLPSFNTFNLSFDFGTKLLNFPVVLGISYIDSETPHSLYSFQYYTDGKISSESYTGFNVSIKTKYFVTLAFGFNTKDYEFVTGDISSPVSEKHNLSDFGFELTLPVKNYKFETDKFIIENLAEFSLGYSQSNSNGAVIFSFPFYMDVKAPKIARAGYSLRVNSRLKYKSLDINLLSFIYSVTAEDNLNQSYYGARFEYFPEEQSFMGDINIGANLLKGIGDKNVIIRKGLKIEAGETFTLLLGGYNGEGFVNESTRGFGLSSGGILKEAAFLTGFRILKFISSHFKVKYFYSLYSSTDYKINNESVNFELNYSF